MSSCGKFKPEGETRLLASIDMVPTQGPLTSLSGAFSHITWAPSTDEEATRCSGGGSVDMSAQWLL